MNTNPFEISINKKKVGRKEQLSKKTKELLLRITKNRIVVLIFLIIVVYILLTASIARPNQPIDLYVLPGENSIVPKNKTDLSEIERTLPLLNKEFQIFIKENSIYVQYFRLKRNEQSPARSQVLIILKNYGFSIENPIVHEIFADDPPPSFFELYGTDNI